MTSSFSSTDVREKSTITLQHSTMARKHTKGCMWHLIILTMLDTTQVDSSKEVILVVMMHNRLVVMMHNRLVVMVHNRLLL